MKRSTNLSLVLFFTLLTFAMTAVVVVAWERVIRDPFFAWVERNYPGEENRRKRPIIQQRVEHFVISITVDVVVVTLLLRIINHKQRELVESEERYRALFEHAGDGIGVVSAADLRLTEVNNRFCQILGFGQQVVVGRDVREIIRPPDGAAANGLASLLGGGEEEGESEFVIATASGTARPVAISFNTLATEKERLIILIIRDLSARHRLEAEREQMRQQLYQTSKLASLGELSAGVAHEINNPLNGIINFAQLLKDEEIERTDFDRQMIDGVIDEGGRIANIVRGLLAFARHDTQQLSGVSLAEAVKSSLALFGRQFDKDGINVETDVPEDLPRLHADASRLRQVVVNMASNAHHSLKAKRAEGKLFRISARGVEREGRSFVRVEFYDNGVGIRPEDLEKVFDPFFTTRRDSGGTGLGLSISFGIIRDHGGTIRAAGAEGRFARFVVELPADEPGKEREEADA
ncbi:MAG: two-component system, NtrC family, sensor kinase [Acidobacteriota bacterium]|jgi:PAS domain S-box-containing protein|nr:two-component system, NtrC family, sensor kinase [Acidobacteriota bacterium]